MVANYDTVELRFTGMKGSITGGYVKKAGMKIALLNTLKVTIITRKRERKTRDSRLSRFNNKELLKIMNCKDH